MISLYRFEALVTFEDGSTHSLPYYRATVRNLSVEGLLQAVGDGFYHITPQGKAALAEYRKHHHIPKPVHDASTR